MIQILSKLNTGLRILPAILKAKYIKPVPIFCQWEITYDCNMDCQFCMPKRNKVLKEKCPELDTDKAIDIIGQLADLGTKILNFSGGEPTLRKDLCILINYAKKRKMSVFFSTNGSTLQYAAKNLLEADMIRVSIDGPKEIHDKIRRHPGAFDGAVEGIRILKKYGKKPMIVTAVSNLMEFKDLIYMAELAKSLGVQIDFSMVGISLPYTIINPQKSDLIKEQTQLVSDIRWFIDGITELKKIYGKTIANPPIHLELLKKGSLAHFGCKASTANISIKPDGAVGFPCDNYTMGLVRGNIKDAFFSKEINEVRKLTGKFWFCDLCYSRCNAFPTMLLETKHLWSIIKSYKSF